MYYVFYMTERQSMLDGLNIQHCSYLFWDFMACSALKIAAVENGKKGNAEPLPFPLRFPSSPSQRCCSSLRSCKGLEKIGDKPDEAFFKAVFVSYLITTINIIMTFSPATSNTLNQQRNLLIDKLTTEVFLFGSRRTENSPSFSLVSLYSFVGRLGVYSA